VWVAGEKGPSRYTRPPAGRSEWVIDARLPDLGTYSSFVLEPHGRRLVIGWGHGLHTRTYIASVRPEAKPRFPEGPYKDPQDIHQRGYAWPTPDGKYLLYRNGGAYEVPKTALVER